MELLKRQATTLDHYRSALKAEFTDWRRRTQAGAPLEKHQTQVARITASLELFLEASGAPVAAGATAFSANERIFRRILGAHRLWDYFRSKLALRDVPWLRNDLVCADEFAWNCYQPAREQAKAAGALEEKRFKEPPLVFFSSEASPFVKGRDMTFALEGITTRDIEEFGEAILKLPIPVISLPWFQVNHLPAAAAIGHEVGHTVERDFGLMPVVETIFQTLPVDPKRLPAWLAWRQEIFADIYGILCTGPASVIALMNYLIDDPQVITKEQVAAPKWGVYPTRWLRMRLNFETLTQLGLDATELSQPWLDVYPFHLMDSFEVDIPKVVAAVLETPLPVFGNQPLRTVIGFTPADVKQARNLAFAINNGGGLAKGMPFRHLFAATTLAYDADPVRYQQENAHKAIIERMIAAIPAGVRSADGVLDEGKRAAHTQVDEAIGRELLDLF